AEHVDLAERPDGLFQGVRAVPRLASAVDQLTAEHPTLLTDLQDYIGLLEGSDGIADVPAFRDEVARLLDRLVEHRRRGDDLIYGAFAVDIGGQDSPGATFYARVGSFSGIPHAAADFYAVLEQDTTTEFWAASRERYERDVREPMAALVA